MFLKMGHLWMLFLVTTSTALLATHIVTEANGQSLKFIRNNMKMADDPHDKGQLINLMSIQMAVAEHLHELPKLPALASQLGLNSLVTYLVKGGLEEALSAKGPLTVFGPLDSAFSTIPDWLKTAIENTTILTTVLKYHVLDEEVLFANVKDEALVKTLTGVSIRFNKYLNNVATAQCAPFEVVSVDNMASNGVLHELKSVMIPPIGNIIQTVSACPEFKTFVSAVETAGLVDVLSDKGPITVFAPTEAAFKKLNPQTLDNLLKNKTALTDVLEYHVTNKTYCSAGLVFFKNLYMQNGKQVNVTVDGEKLKVNDAVVLPQGADGSVENGVVHAIDTVLIPKSLQLDLL